MDIPTTRGSVRLDLLHPWMVTRLEAFFADPRVKGNVKVCSGCRSYADQMRFYKSENHQIVYVSLKEEFPFYYKPKPVEAITPEIDYICRSENSLETISFTD